ncbi:MAG TPA: hydrogenase maturation protease [Gaiellaceae bacterium]|nr:hydrogenase maturation protease [Gaiellaceae bacterium]
MTVIGIGNDWRHDDGAGLEVARRTGGRQLDGEPIGLVSALDGADDVIIVDAVFSGAPPGTIHEFEAAVNRLPTALFGSSSTHALGVSEALEIARSLGRLPARVRVLGIEGARFDYGRGLSPEVESAVERCTRSI